MSYAASNLNISPKLILQNSFVLLIKLFLVRRYDLIKVPGKSVFGVHGRVVTLFHIAGVRRA